MIRANNEPATPLAVFSFLSRSGFAVRQKGLFQLGISLSVAIRYRDDRVFASQLNLNGRRR